MALTRPRPRPASGDGQRPDGRARDLSSLGRRRRLPLVAVAVLAAVGCALAFAVLYLNAGDRRPVLAVANAVPAGQVIGTGDVTVVRVSADPQLTPIPAEDRGSVVGRRAASDLAAGTLLTRAQVGDPPMLASGEAVVGLALGPGRVPTSRLRVGDRVRVVQTLPPGDADGDGGLGRVLAEARVFDVEVLGDVTATVLVSLVVADDVAPAVAGAASADRVSLLLVGDDP